LAQATEPLAWWAPAQSTGRPCAEELALRGAIAIRVWRPRTLPAGLPHRAAASATRRARALPL